MGRRRFWGQILLVFAVCTALAFACKSKRGGGCSDGPKFETLALPATFHVYKSEEYVGAVTVPAAGDPTFLPKSANAELVREFEAEFSKAAQAESVSVRYETAEDGVHNMCGASVKKGTPEYADAFRRHIWDRYYEVKDRAP